MAKSVQELTRRELKGPDRFQVAASDAASWMAKRQKALVAGAAAVLAVAVGVAATSYVLDARKERAGSLLYKAIDAAGGEVSSVPLPNVDRPLYKTTEEKERAVLAAAGKVRAEQGASRAAATAALLEGDAHLALREWDPAIAAYQRFLDNAPTGDSMRFGALDGLARAQEGKGDLAAAATTYEKASSVPFFKDRAELERARILVKAGKKDDAKKALEAVPKDSPLQREAQERLGRLGGS